MARFLTLTLVAAGFAVSMAAAGQAAPVPMPLASQTAAQQRNVTTVYYTWNHHRYNHRRWDKAHKRWNYYN